MSYDEIKETPLLFNLSGNNIEKHLADSLNDKLTDKSVNVQSKLKSLREGDSVTFTTHWDTARPAKYLIDFIIDVDSATSLGSCQVGSDITITATRSGNTIYITGISLNSLDDVYDFNDTTFGLTHSEYNAQKKGYGQPFKIKAEWKSRFSGAATLYPDGTIGNAVLKEYVLDEDNR